MAVEVIHGFRERLAFSLTARQQASDLDTLRGAIPGCVRVRKTDAEIDKTGVDYVATLSGGAEIYIDAKARDRGASKYWRGEPELAMEIWSVMPDDEQDGKPGWTLSETAPVDYILYTFDRTDTDRYYLIPFQMLRMAFLHRFYAWVGKYGIKNQPNARWMSQAVFVPAGVVIEAVAEEMVG